MHLTTPGPIWLHCDPSDHTGSWLVEVATSHHVSKQPHKNSPCWWPISALAVEILFCRFFDVAFRDCSRSCLDLSDPSTAPPSLPWPWRWFRTWEKRANTVFTSRFSFFPWNSMELPDGAAPCEVGKAPPSPPAAAVVVAPVASLWSLWGRKLFSSL